MSGWVIDNIDRILSRNDLPDNRAMPYSVTTQSTKERGTVTLVPGLKDATILDLRSLPTMLDDGSTAIEAPPCEYDAAIANTGCPPGPLYTRGPILSAFT